ncbi:MAG: c-type cytochrome, partial [Cyclobacteriaceae bacterium]|nr:c-type cytochrome [Cyclobacteriaceae bacterium]
MDLNKSIRLALAIVKGVLGLVVFVFAVMFAMRFYPQWFESAKVAAPLATPWKVNSVSAGLPAGEKGQLIRYGHQLVTESPRWMGPMAEKPDMRFAGNNLACKNCHMQAGTQAGASSFVGVTARFPQFRGRENKMGTIEDRVNGCMERSMNGRMLPVDSREMQAIVAYMTWVGEGLPAGREAEFKGFPTIKIPEFAADTIRGRAIYVAQCQVCHGADGQGVRLAGADSVYGYTYPPLWGPDSYNHGAGMHRVLTAAEFIKGNMPFGTTWENPKLSDEEAYHVAAFINQFDRPQK